MITRLIWTIWTPMSSVPQKADKLNLSLSPCRQFVLCPGLLLWCFVYPAVILMEGGTEFDLTCLEVPPPATEEPQRQRTESTATEEDKKEKVDDEGEIKEEEGEKKEEGEMEDEVEEKKEVRNRTGPGSTGVSIRLFDNQLLCVMAIVCRVCVPNFFHPFMSSIVSTSTIHRYIFAFTS